MLQSGTALQIDQIQFEVVGAMRPLECIIKTPIIISPSMENNRLSEGVPFSNSVGEKSEMQSFYPVGYILLQGNCNVSYSL